MSELLYSEITNKVLRAYYTLYNAYPHDYPESFFEAMLLCELQAMRVHIKSQVSYEIRYKGVRVGKHITDIEVEDAVVLELKVLLQLLRRNETQLISNLKISGKKVGLLLNFGGDKPEVRRKVFTGISDRVPIVWHPDDPDSNLIHPELTYQLRSIVWTIYDELGPGFVHHIYINATHVELRQRQINFKRFRKLRVMHRGIEIGRVTFHHFVIDSRIVLAPVTVSSLGQTEIRKVQALLREYDLKLGMIVNFQNEKLEMKYVKR